MKIPVYEKYRDALKITDVKNGIKKCFINASFLLDEAKRNEKNKRYNLAYYLSYTAEEEFIKIYLLLHYFVIVYKENIRSFWIYYTNHIPKKRLMLFKRFIDGGKGKDNKTWLENIYFLLNEKEYQSIRENALYCDVVSRKQFVVPFENFELRDVSETIKKLENKKKKWQELIEDERKLDIALEYLEKNPNKFISPSEAFKKTHGKSLLDK